MRKSAAVAASVAQLSGGAGQTSSAAQAVAPQQQRRGSGMRATSHLEEGKREKAPTPTLSVLQRKRPVFAKGRLHPYEGPKMVLRRAILW